MIKDLGGGWAGTLWPPAPYTPVSIGVQSALVYDPDKRIFGHIATGVGMVHTRPYTLARQLTPDYIRFTGNDGTQYFFQRELTATEQAIWDGWRNGEGKVPENTAPLWERFLNAEHASDFVRQEE